MEWVRQEFDRDYNLLQTAVPHNEDDDITYPSFSTLFDELFDVNSSAEYTDSGHLSRWKSVVKSIDGPSDDMRRRKVYSLMAAQHNCKKVNITNAHRNTDISAGEGRRSARGGITWTLIPKSYSIKQGDVVWWELMKPKFGKDWEDVISITMTNNINDIEVLVYQTYGQPHGSWDFDIITKTQAAINYESILSL
jgi:hypothetical protein